MKEPIANKLGDAEALLELGEVMVACRALQVVAEVGLADVFDGKPLQVAELARATATDPGVLQTMLRLLVTHGVFAEKSDTAFSLTPRGELLRSDHSHSLRAILRHYGTAFRAVLHADHSLRTGEPAFDYVFGQPFFEYLRGHPERSDVFDAAMADISRVEVEAIMSGCDFSGYRRIVDIGGGDGTLLNAILDAHPKVSGVLFDQQHVISRVRYRERLETVAGDFFGDVVSGGDLYLLKSVIHDWPDDQAISILRNCRRAMPEAGRLMLFERLLVPSKTPNQTNNFDMLVFLMVGGRERTRLDVERLFEESGFRLISANRVGPTLYAVEAQPADTA